MPGERCCQRARGDALQLPPSRGWEQGDAAQSQAADSVPYTEAGPPALRCYAGGWTPSSGPEPNPTPIREPRPWARLEDAQPRPEALQEEQTGSHPQTGLGSWGAFLPHRLPPPTLPQPAPAPGGREPAPRQGPEPGSHLQSHICPSVLRHSRLAPSALHPPPPPPCAAGVEAIPAAATMIHKEADLFLTSPK